MTQTIARNPNRSLIEPDADIWLPVVVAETDHRGEWSVRCPDCWRPNPHDAHPGFVRSDCGCEGMTTRRLVDGYVIAPPGAALAPYPDHCATCRTVTVAYTPIDLKPSDKSRGLTAFYVCDLGHKWTCYWGDLAYGPSVPAAPVKPTKEAGPRCILYRHFDAAGVLLYVGISENPVSRGRDHARESDWVQYAHRIEAIWMDTREEAETAERRAIRNERPVFNRAHAIGNVESRIARYLARRDQW